MAVKLVQRHLINGRFLQTYPDILDIDAPIHGRTFTDTKPDNQYLSLPVDQNHMAAESRLGHFIPDSIHPFIHNYINLIAHIYRHIHKLI